MAKFYCKILFILAVSTLVFACKEKKPAGPAVKTHPFPTVEIPSLMTQDDERAQWLTNHLWDRFLDTAACYGSDSLMLNGVLKDEVEGQMGTFVSLLDMVGSKNASEAIIRVFSLSERFSRKYPESGMLEDFAELYRKYVYDPASPLRDEEHWLVFLDQLLYSPLANPDMRASRQWEKRVCSMNRPGSAAPDFAFTDLSGKLHTLYGIKAGYTILIFGNPDCQACRELVGILRSSPEITEMIGSGKLRVVDIYIDEDVESWKAGADSYPEEWLNGYDHLGRINSDRIYAVRGIPSIYLLDKNKTIILKDTPENRLIQRLNELISS